MAIVIQGVSTCALCGELADSKEYMATSGVWYEPDHPLWRYCDAPMHWECYERWPEREAFARDYVAMRCSHQESPYWDTVYEDEQLVLEVSRARALAWLRATGTPVAFSPQSWPEPEPGLHRLERAELAKSQLADRFPTWEDLLAGVDWQAKEGLRERLDREAEERREKSRQQAIAAQAESNALTARWAEQLKTGGLTCPFCQRHTRNVRYCDRRPDQRSYFICQECGCSFEAS
ncbi:hypothetical protein DYH09_19230 [bacterium CPR1]|nr:hypothetical protein [bacterium CPR1]